MNIYELFGREREAHQQECESHARTVDVLARVVSGDLPAERVRVVGSKWVILPEGATEKVVPMPAASGS